MRASGSAPSSAALRSEASTRQAAPSLRVEALPAVTLPPSRNAGRRLGELLERGVGARALVGFDQRRSCGRSARRLDRDELLGEAALGLRRATARWWLRERERVLVLARDRVALGDVLGGLAHRLGRVALRHPRVDQPPAERRVVHRLLAAGQAGLGLRHHPGGAAHRLRAAGEIEVALAEPQRPRGLVDGLEPGGAEAVDGHPGDLDRQARRAAPPSGRRRGCPRRPGSRRPSRRRRPRRDRCPLRSTAAAIACAARSSGRTPASAPR